MLVIKHGKDEIKVKATEATTLIDLAAALQERVALADIKLIAGGKTVYSSGGATTTTVGQLPKGMQTKLLMMGATKSEIERTQTCPPCSQTRRVINDLTPALGGASASASGAAAGGRTEAPSEYRFYDIVPLPGLPDEARARAILTELANDVGILAVMKKHRCVGVGGGGWGRVLHLWRRVHSVSHIQPPSTPPSGGRWGNSPKCIQKGSSAWTQYACWA